MTKNTRDSIQLLANDADSLICSTLEGIDIVKRALQKGYELGAAEIPKERFFEDIKRLIAVSEHIKAAENLFDKIDVLQAEYEPLAKEMKARYADFLTTETIEELDDLESYPKALQEILYALDLMGHAMLDITDPIEKISLIYTGLVKVSETLDRHVNHLTPQGRENIKKIAHSFLIDSTYNPDNYREQKEIRDCMTALKNTARAVLWQIDQYQVERKYTAERILDWMETSRGWAGDDFEDCLDPDFSQESERFPEAVTYQGF